MSAAIGGLPPCAGVPVVWERLDSVIAAWRAAKGADTALTLVVDASLKHLDRALLQRWRSIRERYALIEAPVADDVVLDIAARQGLRVITGDHYEEHRNKHP